MYRYNNNESLMASIALAADRTTGSLNILQNMHKLTCLSFVYNINIVGNIEITFVNANKLYSFDYISLHWSINNNRIEVVDNQNILGNISIFANKYDMEYLRITRCPNIIGQVKNLANLKKLYYCELSRCNCTGSKTDLYNNGANVTGFYI